MPANTTDIDEFLDTISDEKLENWQTRQYTVVENFKIGLRLDHQGMNKDGSGMNRLYIQPIKGGSSRYSKVFKSGTVLANVHVADPAEPKNVRQALKESAANNRELVIAKPKE